MIHIFLLFYRPLYAAFKWILIAGQSLWGSKLKAAIELKEQPLNIPSLKPDVFWFHASSGEIEYVKSLIRESKVRFPNCSLIVSYSSPSATKLFDSIQNQVDFFFPLPWDQPRRIQNLLKQLQPKAFFFARTDLWSELIYQLTKTPTKIYIISYNPSLNFLNRLWSRLFLSHFSGIFCTEPFQESILKDLVTDPKTVSCPGDTRFDQVFWRLQQPTKVPFQIPTPYLVLGSTWPEDENIFTPLLNQIVAMGYKIVWSPHEIQTANIHRISLILQKSKLTYQKFSDLSSTEVDVILIDRIGYLADFYRHADGAFIGWSFKAKVHSVMEPLCCAIPVITGPHIQNSPEAMRYHQIIMNELRVVQVTTSSNEFIAALEKIKTMQKGDFKKLLIGNLEKNRYATRRIMNSIFDN